VRISLLPKVRFRDLAAPLRRRSRSALDARISYTYDGRAAIYQVLKALPPKPGACVLVPGFHCPTVVDPVLQAGHAVRYYRIKRDLTIDEHDLHMKLDGEVSAVIVIHYFGFPAKLDTVLERKQSDRFVLIEDCAHSFLQDDPPRLTGGHGDAAIYSFRKLVAMHAGGAIRLNNRSIKVPTPARSLAPRQYAVMLKRMFEQACVSSDLAWVRQGFEYFESRRVRARRRKPRPAQSSNPGRNDSSDPYRFDIDLANTRLPGLSRRILDRTDLGKVARARRENYRRLAHVLRDGAFMSRVYPDLPDEVCPWVFPILVPNRDHYDHRLRKLGVPVSTFGELLHSSIHELKKGDAALDDARYLSDTLLMIPVHQDLGLRQVSEYAETINRFFEQLPHVETQG